MSKNQDIYITISNNKMTKSVLKIMVDSDKIVIPATLKSVAPSDKNFHTTRHNEFLHRTAYVCGEASKNPDGSYCEYKRTPLNAIENYEIIGCNQISPVVLERDSFKEYKKSKPQFILTAHENATHLIYIFATPKSNEELYQSLNYYKIKHDSYPYENFDIVIAEELLQGISSIAVTDALEMYIRTHPNVGIGDFKPLYAQNNNKYTII